MTGVVLAGGKGRRLGRPKALVELEGQPLIQRIIKLIEPIFDELLIVADQTEELQGLGVRVVADAIPGCGSLGGIYSGLCQASSPYIFCFACDMPFLNADLIKYMIDNCDIGDVLIPRQDGELHPLHAVYSQACREPIRSRLARHELKIINFFPQVKVGYVTQAEVSRLDPTGYALFNINTRQDLKLARGIARRISH
jgi:molybdopterin-guanine dinucleotide biosynthesis protein A